MPGANLNFFKFKSVNLHDTIRNGAGCTGAPGKNQSICIASAVFTKIEKISMAPAQLLGLFLGRKMVVLWYSNKLSVQPN
jgi:hypothetical protein